MTTKTKKTPLNVFTCLGVEIEPRDEEEAVGTCPFCDKENHLYVRYAGKKALPSGRWSLPGHWKCHACDSSGGITRFLTLLVEAGRDSTVKEDYKALWTKKRIPPAIAKLCSVCRNPLTGDWLIPTFKMTDKGTVVQNIHRWWESKNKLLGTDTLTLDILGRQFLSPDNQKPLWIAEGHWDWLILEHLFRAAKLRDEVDVIGVPGAGLFQYDWLSLITKRPRLVILFDNDYPKTHPKTGKVTQAGLDGVKKIISMIDGMDDDDKPPEAMFLTWPEGLEDGYDLRDLYMSTYQEMAA